MSTCRIPVSPRRARRQGGNEIIEFALFLSLLGPLLGWVFVSGMNVIRSIEASHVCRDIGNLYIHGADYSTADAQNTAYYLAQGFGLQLSGNTPATAAFTGNSSTNDSNSGNGWIVLSEIMYVGTNTCAGLPSGTTCTNQGKYVFLQRIGFGNKNVQFNGSSVHSLLGAPTGSAAPNAYGNVANYLTDDNAVSSTAGNFITLGDGQVAYVAETFFASPDLGMAAYPGGGIYTRTFF